MEAYSITGGTLPVRFKVAYLIIGISIANSRNMTARANKKCLDISIK